MKTAALIGYPLAHSVTPAMYAAAFAAMGLDGRCEKWVTPPEQLRDRVQALRKPAMFGANVTVPHKEAVMALLDHIDPDARRIGAVNCIVRAPGGILRGYNTDAYGFMRSLDEAGFRVSGATAVVLGAGGAARAVVVGLTDGGVAKVTISNRTRQRADALARDLDGASTALEVVDWHGEGFDRACIEAGLLVNTTPMGTAHTELADESPLDARHFARGAFAFDLVYNPPLTPFLRLAAQAGATAVSGLDMLVYQGAESIRLWTGGEPPIEAMREAARSALTLGPRTPREA